MYKNYFINKKVAIFDLETIIEDFYLIYIKIFNQVLADLKIDWVYLEDLITDGLTINEIWLKIIDQPFIDKKFPYSTIYNSVITGIAYYIQNNNLYLNNGVLELLYELKTENGYTLVLKSELNELITKSLIEKLDIQNTFDLIIFQGQQKQVDLYKQILIQLSKYKIKNKDCIAFDSHPSLTDKSSRHGILTIGIKGKTQLVDNFSYRVALISNNFEKFSGNINKTYKEAYLDARPSIKEKVEKKLNIKL